MGHDHREGDEAARFLDRRSRRGRAPAAEPREATGEGAPGRTRSEVEGGDPLPERTVRKRRPLRLPHTSASRKSPAASRSPPQRV